MSSSPSSEQAEEHDLADERHDQDDRADDRQEHRDPEQQDADRAVEERLDREVAAEHDGDRDDRRQDPEPDDDREDAIRSPTLSAAHASPSARRRTATAAPARTRGGGAPRGSSEHARLAGRRPGAVPAAMARRQLDDPGPERREPRLVLARARSPGGPRRSASSPAAPRSAATSASRTGSGARAPRRPRRRTSSRSVLQLADARLEHGRRLRRRRHLDEPGEPERVGPRLADGPGPGVLRPGRRPLAGEPVAGVEAPEAAVAVDPGVLVGDDDRRPLVLAAGPDGRCRRPGRSRRTGRSAPAGPCPTRSPGSGWPSVSRQTRRSRSSGPRRFRSPGNGSRMMYSPRSR